MTEGLRYPVCPRHTRPELPRARLVRHECAIRRAPLSAFCIFSRLVRRCHRLSPPRQIRHGMASSQKACQDLPSIQKPSINKCKSSLRDNLLEVSGTQQIIVFVSRMPTPAPDPDVRLFQWLLGKLYHSCKNFASSQNFGPMMAYEGQASCG